MNRKIVWTAIVALACGGAALWQATAGQLALDAEPGPYGLALSGLGVAAWVAARRRPG
ncbi:PEP-CTERM sorting domain-containing protein [Eleftheria terrae]|uniref:PEP-CTERM sorting domain-containing protein n=1 Tax=Eleftheria terrae TaxID=1597781 RepID=UPI00263AA3A4|nr:PEP-CTERM sorting domain-containing protein [Eleftheria terrae]WKB55367.1 hypothetical protein N7L95_25125 [Eleftheria terrae]